MREGGPRPSLFGNPTRGGAIIKSRLCRFAAKVGGGLWPPFRKSSCHSCTALHFRAKAAALQEAETMQHLGEISEAQCSRGRDNRDKRQVKARKGFSNRRFERRFWVLLPPGAKVPRAGARNVLLTIPPSRLRRATSASLRYAQPSVSTGPPRRGRRGCSA